MEKEPPHSKEETDSFILQPQHPLCGDRDESFRKNKTLKLPAHRAGLPGKAITLLLSAFIPAYKAGHSADIPVMAQACIPKNS
jgi:hypothetical protein